MLLGYFPFYLKMAASVIGSSTAEDGKSSVLSTLPKENRDLILSPLMFPDESEADLDYGLVEPDRDVPLLCLACEAQFACPPTAKEEFLKHILVEHKIVIGKSRLISSMKRYSSYWKKRLKDQNWTEFMVVVKNYATPSKDGPGEEYYLLSDVLPEDKELRQKLHLQRLKMVISIQEKERNDLHFSKMCLFCSQVFTGNRSSLFMHMLEQHNFNIGHYDNVVFVDEFLHIIEKKLNNLQCLFCEKIFKDRPTLKDHMRKKQHRKLDPMNTEYDKYYIVNYLEFGKTWRELTEEEDYEVVSRPSHDERELTSFGEEEPPIHCLFCTRVSQDWSHIEDHMLKDHHFSLSASTEGTRLDFYLKVKVVNFIRRQIHFRCCPHCGRKFDCSSDLHEHMAGENHCRLPSDWTLWNQSQYLFSTFENDSLLYYLDEIGESTNGEEDANEGERDSTSLPGGEPPKETTAENTIEQFLLGDVLKDIEGD